MLPGTAGSLDAEASVPRLPYIPHLQNPRVSYLKVVANDASRRAGGKVGEQRKYGQVLR